MQHSGTNFEYIGYQFRYTFEYIKFNTISIRYRSRITVKTVTSPIPTFVRKLGIRYSHQLRLGRIRLYGYLDKFY